MLEAGVPFATVATIMGWSAASSARMWKRYGHIGDQSQRDAVNVLGAKPDAGYYKHSPKSADQEDASVQ